MLNWLNREFSRRLGYHISASRQLADMQMMLDHSQALNAAYRATPLSPDLEARIVLLGRLLKPRRVTSRRKIRVGGRNDGGYVMIDDFARLRTAFSLGVGPNVDWDHAMAERGIAIHQFDHTVPGPPRRHALFRFHKRRIDGEPSADTENLESLMRRYGSSADHSNLLKVDIEGSEWALFAKAGSETLAKFPQILCEFHALGHVHDEPHYRLMIEALRRLRQDFEVVHLHGNNCGGRVFVGGQAVPQVMEVTLANKALYAFTDGSEVFPTPLDTPNDGGLPDYYLGGFGFEDWADVADAALDRRAETGQCRQGFDAAAYLSANPDVLDAGHDPWTHWWLFGRGEGRPMSVDEKGFDTEAYLAANPDVAAAGFDGLTHWRHFGRREERPLSPDSSRPSRPRTP